MTHQHQQILDMYQKVADLTSVLTDEEVKNHIRLQFHRQFDGSNFEQAFEAAKYRTESYMLGY